MRFEVKSRSGCTLATIEQSELVTSSETALSREYLVQKILKTPHYIARRGIIDPPEIMMYFLEDWKHDLEDYNQNFGRHTAAADIVPNCLGGHGSSFMYLYRLWYSDAKWELTEFDDTGIMVQRILPNRDYHYRVDLRQCFLPESGLLLESEFGPLGKNDEIHTHRVQYTDIHLGARTMKVPVLITKDSSCQVSEASRSTVRYSHIRDEHDLPALTLGDMGVPRGAQLNRITPDNRSESRRWDGGDPVAVFGIAPM